MGVVLIIEWWGSAALSEIRQSVYAEKAKTAALCDTDEPDLCLFSGGYGRVALQGTASGNRFWSYH